MQLTLQSLDGGCPGKKVWLWERRLFLAKNNFLRGLTADTYQPSFHGGWKRISPSILKKDLSQQHTPDTYKCYLLHQDGSELLSQVFVCFCKFGLNSKTFVLYYNRILFAIPRIVLKMSKCCLRTDIYRYNHYLSAFSFHYFHFKWFFVQYIFWKKNNCLYFPPGIFWKLRL